MYKSFKIAFRIKNDKKISFKATLKFLINPIDIQLHATQLSNSAANSISHIPPIRATTHHHSSNSSAHEQSRTSAVSIPIPPLKKKGSRTTRILKSRQSRLSFPAVDNDSPIAAHFSLALLSDARYIHCQRVKSLLIDFPQRAQRRRFTFLRSIRAHRARSCTCICKEAPASLYTQKRH